MINPWSARASVTLVSKNIVKKEPDFASIGGFTVIDMQDNETIFDWVTSEGSTTIREDGRLQLEWYLKEFDEEFYRESNDGKTEAPDWDKIIKSAISEVYYEVGYMNDGEEVHLSDMHVLSFNIHLWDDEKQDYVTSSFSQEALVIYNDKEESA